MIVSLFGPEFMLHIAWIQFVLARWVMRAMNKVEKRSVQTIISYVIKLYLMFRGCIVFVARTEPYECLEGLYHSLPCLYSTNIFIWLRRSQTDVEI